MKERRQSFFVGFAILMSQAFDDLVRCLPTCLKDDSVSGLCKWSTGEHG